MKQPVRIAIVGAALSANKGAAAMLETVIARMPDVVGECRFDILTTYPQADAQRVPIGSDVRIVGLQPLRLALVEFPIACLVFVARLLRLPTFWVRSRGCRSMLDSDVVVDVAGISFADGRGVAILGYNVLMTGVPLLLGVPTVKAAQAMGPFKTLPTKIAAKLVLPHLATICARGARTREHLDSLRLANVVDVADLAFSLSEAVELPSAVATSIRAAGDDFVVVMPSAVVKGIFESQGGNYVGAVAQLVSEIRIATGKGVVIAPHSYRVGMPEGRMNDGPVCREVSAACAADPMVVGVDADLTAGELRKLVSMGSVLVTSRFHAMISGLATCTPTVVVGWSHKYKEVLDDFGLAQYGMDSTELANPQKLGRIVGDVLAHREQIAAQIRDALPAVQERSMKNFALIAAAVKA